MPLRLEVVAKPGSRAPGISICDGTVTVAVRERPIDGAANDAILRSIAQWLGVAPSRITLLRGTSGRRKVFLVEGIESLPAQIER